jgi:hypothetical protein
VNRIRNFRTVEANALGTPDMKLLSRQQHVQVVDSLDDRERKRVLAILVEAPL